MTISISIILPTYNGEETIEKSINSVINQSFKDWELIVVNDCSSDNTKSIIEKYAKKDKRIKIINNKINQKLPRSLNIGFKAACGKYYTWTSDDNMYKKDALMTMYNYLENNTDVDFVSCDSEWLDEEGNYIGKHSNWGDRSTPLTLSWVCNIGACFMYKSSVVDLVGIYNEALFCAEDYDYWCRIALQCNMKYLKNIMYTYISNKKSLSYTHKEQAERMGDIVREMYANLIITKYAKSYIEACITYGRLKNKYHSFNGIPFIYKIGIVLLYIFPKFLINFLPLRKYRILLRDKLNGINQKL